METIEFVKRLSALILESCDIAHSSRIGALLGCAAFLAKQSNTPYGNLEETMRRLYVTKVPTIHFSN